MYQANNTEDLETKLTEAKLYESHGLVKEAATVYKELLKNIDSQQNPELHAKVETLLGNLGPTDIEGAVHFSQKTSSVLKKEATVEDQYDTCLALIEAGFHNEAIDELNLLFDSDLPPHAIHAKTGECYLCLDKHYEAIEHLEKAITDTNLKNNDDRLDIFDRLAIAYESIGGFKSAINALEQMVRISPDFRNGSERLQNLTKTAKNFGRFSYLVRKKLLSVEDLEQAKGLAKKADKSVDTVLLNELGIEKSQLGKSLSEYYRCPFVEFQEAEIGSVPSCIQGIKENFFRVNNCIPISEEKGKLIIATNNPFDMVKTDNIRMITKAADFTYAVAVKEDIEKYIDYYFGKFALGEETEEDLFEQLELVEELEEEIEDEVRSQHAEGVVVKMANKIIEDAIKQKASDIHIESLAEKKGTTVRFRVDGDCGHYKNIPHQYKRALVSRLKILAKLDISEKRLPQDGKIKFRTKSRKNIELRVATIPTAGGFEDVVMRILTDTKALPIDKMMLLPHNIEHFKQMLEMPYGLILVVGPTGSGKTTTLHAALNHINRPDRKIWTVEDPVEIVQDGLRQVQVQPNIDLTFNRVLKAFLRADPDVIMVGETRDEETAKTVIEASLTGHLVFTTLHTNSAPETITRLLGMGIESYSFADCLIGVIAQRLVKQLCPKCKEAHMPDKLEKKTILKEYGPHALISLTADSFKGATLYKPKGCGHCSGSGYKGRIAIHEMLKVDDDVKRLIEKNKPASDIRDQAQKSGMLTLKQDGIHKVLMGETDFKQVRAACIK